MKPIIVLFFIFSFSSALSADEFYIDWSCQQNSYQGVNTLPSSEKVRVRINRRGKLRFKPNIFRNNIIDSVKSIFKRRRQTQYSIDYSDCIYDFANRLEKKSGKLILKDKLIKRVHSFGYFKSQRKTKVLPRLYPNHKSLQPLTTISFDKTIELSQKVCESKQLSFKDKLLLTSNNYFDSLKKVLRDELFNLSSICVEKIFDLNNRILPTSVCKGALFCTQIQQQINQYHKLSSDINEIRQKNLFNKNKKETFEKRTLALGVHLPSSESDKIEHMFNDFCDPSKERKYVVVKNNFFKKPLTVTPSNIPIEFNKFLKANKDKLSKSCKSDLLSNFITHYTLNKNTLIKKDECLGLRCDLINQLDNSYNEIIDSLLDDLFKSQHKELVCSIKEQFSKPYDSLKIENLLNEAQEVIACQELKVGETKVSNTPNYKSKTGIRMNYALERKSEKKYQATIALNITHDKELYPDIKQTPQELLRDVQECMNFSSSYFKGPDGKSIDVKIISIDDQAKLPSAKKPPIVNIAMQKSSGRVNSGTYTENINCPTITHEILHLMGLVDEYHESSRGSYINTATGKTYLSEEKWEESEEYDPSQKVEWKNAFNQCRSISESTSIMSDQYEMFKDTVKQARECSCKDNQLCHEVMTSENQNIKDIYLNQPLQSFYDQAILGCEVIEETKALSFEEIKEKSPTKKIFEDKDSISFTHLELARGQNNKSFKEAQYLQTSYSCNCNNSPYPNKRQRCNKRMKELKTGINNGKTPPKWSCPSGTESTGKDLTDISGDIPPISDYNEEDLTFNIFLPTTSKSLLQPAHFEVLLSGNCKTKAKTYSTCAKNAYKKYSKDCPDIPDYCKDDNKWLKSTK